MDNQEKYDEIQDEIDMLNLKLRDGHLLNRQERIATVERLAEIGNQYEQCQHCGQYEKVASLIVIGQWEDDDDVKICDECHVDWRIYHDHFKYEIEDWI